MSVITFPSPPNVRSSEPSEVSRASAKRDFPPKYAAGPATRIFPFVWMRMMYRKSAPGVKSMDIFPSPPPKEGSRESSVS